jgi:hypothetical protein
MRLLLGVGLLLVWSSVPLMAGEGKSETLRLAWVDVSGLPRGWGEGAVAHARELLEAAGVRVAATAVPAGSVVAARTMIVVMGREREGAARETVWGAAPGDAESTIWVYPGRIASDIGLDPETPHAWRAVETLVFRRLLGLVVVHELLHRLVGARHEEDGLMTRALSPSADIFAHAVPPALRSALLDGVARFAAGLSLPATRPAPQSGQGLASLTDAPSGTHAGALASQACLRGADGSGKAEGPADRTRLRRAATRAGAVGPQAESFSSSQTLIRDW